jgi:hypothetical protein
MVDAIRRMLLTRPGSDPSLTTTSWAPAIRAVGSSADERTVPITHRHGAQAATAHIPTAPPARWTRTVFMHERGGLQRVFTFGAHVVGSISAVVYR